jgi:predicted acylesterase/phospholipase RssA
MTKSNFRFGVVMSGGGAYGAFQAGVLDAFFQDGFKPSHFSGTSIGAFNSVLASGHCEKTIQDFWLSVPKVMQEEIELAKSQWEGTLSAFTRAAGGASIQHYFSEIAKDIAKQEIQRRMGWPFRLPVPIFGMPDPCGQILPRELVESTEKLNLAIRNAIQAQIDRVGNDSAIITEKTAAVIKDTLERAKLHAQVNVTVADLGDITAEHILLLYESKSIEIGAPHKYIRLNKQNKVDATIASMAVPFVFGKGNSINPTQYYDGGLADNLPIAALAPMLETEQLDYIVVIDVSGTLERLLKTKCKFLRSGPIIYINLEKPSGLENLLNFEKSADLFREGGNAGWLAIQNILSKGAQDIRDVWAKSEGISDAHVVKRKIA